MEPECCESGEIDEKTVGMKRGSDYRFRVVQGSDEPDDSQRGFIKGEESVVKIWKRRSRWLHRAKRRWLRSKPRGVSIIKVMAGGRNTLS